MIDNPHKNASALTVLSLESDWTNAESCIGTLVKPPQISNERRYRQHVLGSLAAYSSIGIINAKYRYGLSEFTLERNRAGIPIWPNGFVGSISHSGDVVAALVAPNSMLRAVGLDVQRIVPLRKDIAKRIANRSEQEWIAQDSNESNIRSLILFSAKECYYKALSPLLGHSFSFRDIQLKFGTKNNFQVLNAWMRTLGNYPKGWPLSQPIYVQVVGDYIASTTAVPH